MRLSRLRRLRSEYRLEIELMLDAGGVPLAHARPRDLAGSAAGALERYGLPFLTRIEDPLSAMEIDDLGAGIPADLPKGFYDS